jgi:teichuronic acid exporter
LKDLKKKAAKGILWTFVDRAGSQFIGFVITIFLARLLSPAEFGLVAMASVVIAITRIFIDSGLNDSLIQKQHCTEEDYNTVFYFNMVMSVVLFCIIYFTAPFIAAFFGYAELTPIIRVLGLKPIIASFAFVQMAMVHKQLNFGAVAKIRIPAFLISGFIGLGIAWYGYGVWALVIQSIAETLLFNILLWLTATWRPSLMFNLGVFKFHWQHGSRLLVVNALGAIYRNIFSLIIGKFFSPAQLGFYSRADSFRTIILNNTTGLIQTVSYPVLAQMQDDNVRLKSSYRKILQTTLFGLLPIIAVFIVAAEPIIKFLLTDKWLPAAPILVVLMLALVFSPFNSINLNILKVKRRTDLLLRTDLINKSLLIIIVLITVNLGFDYVVMTNLIIAVFALFINNYYTNKLIGYSIKEQLMDFWPMIFSFVIAVLSTTYITQWTPDTYLFIDILIKGVLTIIVYALTVLAVKKQLIVEMIAELKSIVPFKSVSSTK